MIAVKAKASRKAIAKIIMVATLGFLADAQNLPMQQLFPMPIPAPSTARPIAKPAPSGNNALVSPAVMQVQQLDCNSSKVLDSLNVSVNAQDVCSYR